MRNTDLNNLLNNDGQAYEIAVLLHQPDLVNSFVQEKRSDYPALTIRYWGEIAPELGMMIGSLDQYLVIFLVIILLALSFGIVNTMLMAVLDRVREIGVLMAIGMTRFRLFSMIFLETFFIVGLAAPIGLLLAYSTITYLGATGMNISGLYDEAYASFGLQPIIRPHLEGVHYLRILSLVAITALLASIYPAYTAMRLDPVQAIRKI